MSISISLGYIVECSEMVVAPAFSNAKKYKKVYQSPICLYENHLHKIHLGFWNKLLKPENSLTIFKSSQLSFPSQIEDDTKLHLVVS